jgi:GT2 family glycosyltransferase
VEESTGLLRLRSGWVSGSAPLPRGFSPDRRMDVDWVRGAFLVARSELCRTVGVLDPEFFMYGEEMEWCYRVRRSGWRILYLPVPSIVHIEGASSRPLAGPMYVENLKGRLRFFRKHRGTAERLLAAGIIALSVIPRWLVRELQLVAGGSRVSEHVRLQRDMFRAAAGWIAMGMPAAPGAPPTDEPR